MRTKGSVWFFLLCVICLWQNARSQERQIGFVLDVHGEWLVAGKPLHKGEPVQADDEVRMSPKAKFGDGKIYFINIILLNNRSLSKACSTLQSCSEPLLIPPSINVAPSLAQRISEAAMRLFSRQPERYVPTLSRSVLVPDESLAEGLVKLDGNTMTLAGLLINMKRETYVLDLRAIGLGGEAADGTGSTVVQFDWNVGSSSVITVSRLRPGLYDARLLKRAKDEVVPTDAEAWLLVVDSSRYDKVSRSFREAVEVTKQWDGVDEYAKRSFLRACLEYLAAH